MVIMTEELNFKILIFKILSLSNHMWLVATVWDSAALEYLSALNSQGCGKFKMK